MLILNRIDRQLLQVALEGLLFSRLNKMPK
jgi:hypothetical protein